MTASIWAALGGNPTCTRVKQDTAKSLRSRGCCGAAKQPPQQQQPSQGDDISANNNGKNGTSDGMGKASSDVLRLFSETQRNLLELNRSRLSALDELRVAKNRITDLAWTDLPGVEMQPGKDKDAGYKVVQVRGNQLEFVLNDGAGQWDTPDPYGSSQTKNYAISTSGTYKLEAGEISKVQ